MTALPRRGEHTAGARRHRLRRPAIVLFVCMFAAAGAATAQIGSKPLSLSISGGASKGAYEAGLNWALLHIFRSFGGGVHLGFSCNRLRLSLGARDFGRPAGSWFLTVGIADLPGIAYWLTR